MPEPHRFSVTAVTKGSGAVSAGTAVRFSRRDARTAQLVATDIRKRVVRKQPTVTRRAFRRTKDEA